MALEKSGPAKTRAERGTGNIYDRLSAARQQRERALDTPEPANYDHAAPSAPKRPFPRLKPPANDIPEVAEPHRMEWMLPIAIGLIILAVLFGYAVG